MNKKEYAKITKEFKKSEKEKEFKKFIRDWSKCWIGSNQGLLNYLLHRKIWYGSFDLAKELIKNGAEINSISDDYGYGAPLDMMKAVYSSEKSMIAFLKKKGAKTKKELLDKGN